jgi:hypothetical protein
MKMKMLKMLNWRNAVLLSCSLFFLQACDDDESNPITENGDVEFEITDAPSDDDDISGVFVTVADVKVNGESIGLAEKQTIDLKAYANGDTKVIGTATLDARAYNSLTLVLDNAEDADGNSPGNYVQTQDNTKHMLTASGSGTTEITINKTWDVQKNATSNIVVDFDLRKSIRHSDGQDSEYEFVSEADLKSAVRVVQKSKTGTIDGIYDEDFMTEADKVIVYGYSEGEFDAEEETTANADGMIFTKAVLSAEVEPGLTDTYRLSFVEEGDYELVFVSYTENETTGEFEFTALLESETEINGSVTDVVSVDAGATVSVSAIIIGLLP